MASWTTVTELYRSLRETAPAEDTDEYEEAEQAIAAAVGAIEDEAGQALAESTDTVTLDGPGGTELILPRWPVTAITSITLLEDATVLEQGFDADYTWSDAGIVCRVDGDCWPCEQRSIQVVYTAGWDTVPIGLKKIAWRLVATDEDNPSGLESEKIGDWSGKWKADVVAGELTQDEKDRISKYAVRQ